MPNFDFYVCLRIKFHKSSFWVLILAAGGPYWVSISQRNGSLSQCLGVPNSASADQVVCEDMGGCVGPPLPVELVCPLCKDLVDEAVGFFT